MDFSVKPFRETQEFYPKYHTPGYAIQICEAIFLLSFSFLFFPSNKTAEIILKDCEKEKDGLWLMKSKRGFQ
jgi:hypothetical protein